MLCLVGHSYDVFIDESGDDGFVFNDDGTGSSRWFVLTAVMIPHVAPYGTVHLAADVRRAINLKPNATIHFSDIPHERRVRVASLIAQSPLIHSSVIINKQAITDRATFGGNFRMYYYASRLLLERISWYCRDNPTTTRKTEDGTAKIIFEHRKKLSYDDLRYYFRILRTQIKVTAKFEVELAKDVQIHWPVIKDDQIEAASKGKFAGLQIADCIAGGLRAALEFTPYKYTEHRYAKMLRPNLYFRSGKCRGYGLKFFPELPAKPPELLHWIEKHYKDGK